MDDNKLGPHNSGQPWCVGRGRWADEHRVHSHPDVAPCDLDVSPSFVIGRGVPSSYQKQFSKAPRFPMSTYHVEWKGCPGKGEGVTHRLNKYRSLYGPSIKVLPKTGGAGASSEKNDLNPEK